MGQMAGLDIQLLLGRDHTHTNTHTHIPPLATKDIYIHFIIIFREWGQDGRGVRHGAYLLLQTHKKKSTCRMICTEHLLNIGRRH